MTERHTTKFVALKAAAGCAEGTEKGIQFAKALDAIIPNARALNDDKVNTLFVTLYTLLGATPPNVDHAEAFHIGQHPIHNVI